MSLVTTEPDKSIEEKLRFKYANLACELLTSDAPAINDILVSDHNSLNKLCSFLDSEQKLNPLLASFFSKTLGLLCAKRTEYFFEFLQTKETFVTLMINHIETSAVMDLLLKIITGVDNFEVRGAIAKVSFISS